MRTRCETQDCTSLTFLRDPRILGGLYRSLYQVPSLAPMASLQVEGVHASV